VSIWSSTVGFQACIAFHDGKYEVARGLYADVIVTNPSCPASVRVGLGMCLYKLGHIDAALAAFKRALQLDVTATAPAFVLPL
jgi:RNA polymerase-associated protein CTR9